MCGFLVYDIAIYEKKLSTRKQCETIRMNRKEVFP
jgi:hypothetical protein